MQLTFRYYCKIGHLGHWGGHFGVVKISSRELKVRIGIGPLLLVRWVWLPMVCKQMIDLGRIGCVTGKVGLIVLSTRLSTTSPRSTISHATIAENHDGVSLMDAGTYEQHLSICLKWLLLVPGSQCTSVLPTSTSHHISHIQTTMAR